MHRYLQRTYKGALLLLIRSRLHIDQPFIIVHTIQSVNYKSHEEKCLDPPVAHGVGMQRSA